MTKKRLDFCIYYIETRSARESAKLAGYSISYAEKQSHLLLRNEDIKEKLAYFEEKFYRDEFKKLALKSIKKLDNIISSSEIESVQLNASKFVLSQAGISDKEDSATQTIQIKIKGLE